MQTNFFSTADPAWYELLKENARRMRKEPTEAEAFLWQLLKGKDIGHKFRRQHIIQDFIVDFICLDKMLTIELDGMYHNTPEQIEYDKYRTENLKKLGYLELRFTNEELFHQPEAVIERIKEECSNRPSDKKNTYHNLNTIIISNNF